MPTPVVISLGSITSQVAGAAVNVDYTEQLAVYVAGTFAATVKVQASADGTNWVQVGSDLTAPGIVAVTSPAKFVRINVTAYTSGTVVGHAVAKDEDRKG